MTLSGKEGNIAIPNKTNRPRRSSTSATKSSFYGKPLYRTQSLQKAFEKLRVIKVRFYRNGDRFHQGLVYVVSTSRFRTFDSLLVDLTKRLADKASLPKGVRFVFTSDGSHKVKSLDDLVEGCSYVCASFDAYKRVDYGGKVTPDWCVNVRAVSSTSMGTGSSRQMNRTFQFHENDMRSCTSSESLNRSLHIRYNRDNTTQSQQFCSSSGGDDHRNFIRPRLVFIIRSGNKPRKSIRLLLNRKTCHSLEQVFNDITNLIKLDSGVVRKVYGLSGKQVLSLQDFFLEDDIFIAYGNHEKTSQDDFVVAPQEARTIRPYTTQQQQQQQQPESRPKRVVLQRKHNHNNNKNTNGGGSTKKQRPVSMPSSSSVASLHRQQNASSRSKKMSLSTQKSTTSSTQHQHHQVGDKWPTQVNDLYEVGEVIGDGTYAEVRRCFERSTGNKFALKIVDRSKYVGKESLAVNEVNLLRSIRHRNIIRLIRDLQTSHDIYMVLEYANGGDLFETISSPYYSYTEHEASTYLFDILNALAYLHDNTIVHRDVKPENLLVSINAHGKRSLKLADFGMATIMKSPLYTVCGTPTYVAPEIIIHNGYGYEVDIWAAGIITYIMLCGYPPFRSNKNNQEELFDAIIDHDLRYPTQHWDRVSPDAFEMIHLGLTSDPKQRPTAHELLNHSWLQQVRHQNEMRRQAVTSSTACQQQVETQQPPVQQSRLSKKKRVNASGRTLKDYSER